jgi:hypothetical protein
MLTLGVIANIRAFMERAQLSGKEVQAYNEIMTALAREEAQLTSPPPSSPNTPSE